MEGAPAYKIVGADNAEYGPVSAEVVRQWIAEGRANGLTRILPENSTEWKLLRDLPEFAPALASVATPAPAAPAGAAPAPFPITQQPRTNGLATTGLVLGIFSLTFGLCCCSGLPFSIAGIICSGIALSQLNRNPQQQGRGIALAGLVVSIIGLLVGLLVSIIYGMVSSMPDVMRRIQRL